MSQEQVYQIQLTQISHMNLKFPLHTMSVDLDVLVCVRVFVCVCVFMRGNSDIRHIIWFKNRFALD